MRDPKLYLSETREEGTCSVARMIDVGLTCLPDQDKAFWTSFRTNKERLPPKRLNVGTVWTLQGTFDSRR